MKASACVVTRAEARHAAQQAAVQALADIGEASVDFAVCFASEHYLADAEEVLAGVQGVLDGAPLIGAVAEGVIGGGREIEDEPAVSLWLASGIGAVETFDVEYLGTPSGGLFAGHRFEAGGGPYVLLCDPFSFPIGQLLEHLGQNLPGISLAGGMVSGGSRGRQSRMFLDDRVVSTGAVGANLSSTSVDLFVSQGCRPIGSPFTVTSAEGNSLHGIGGRPPLQRLQELVETLSPRDRELLADGGLQFGLVIDEYRDELRRGDFLIRNIVAADPATGSIAVGTEVEMGQTVQFQVRDAASASEDLQELLERELSQLGGREPAGALLFCCNGRGSRFFGQENHDAGMVTKILGGPPLAGLFCAGEIGPIGGKNFVHGFSASLIVFRGGGDGQV